MYVAQTGKGWGMQTNEPIVSANKNEQLKWMFGTLGMLLVSLGGFVAYFEHHLDQRFDVIYTRFDLIDKRFDFIDKRMDGIDKRFDGIDKRMDGLDKRIDHMETRFDNRFDALDKRLDGLKKTAP
jgi:tetrahydromethanopterin S-methyltransferase subunit G